jgi:hypothetical protein
LLIFFNVDFSIKETQQVIYETIPFNAMLLLSKSRPLL